MTNTTTKALAMTHHSYTERCAECDWETTKSVKWMAERSFRQHMMDYHGMTVYEARQQAHR